MSVGASPLIKATFASGKVAELRVNSRVTGYSSARSEPGEARRPRAAKVLECHLLELEENSVSVGGASQSLVRWYYYSTTIRVQPGACQ